MARESRKETVPCIPWPTTNLCGPLPSAYKILPAIPTDKPPAPPRRRQDKNGGTQAPAPLPIQEKGRLRAPAAPPGPHEVAHALGLSPHRRPEQRRALPCVAPNDLRRRAPPTSRAYFSDFKKGLVPSVSSSMQRKGSEALTGTELNAAVYRYLQDSGFVHTAFNFFYEADIERGNIQGMIPQGTLIRIVHKGLEYIELEANSEIGSDDEHHFFDTLDLMTNDLDELRKKVTSSSQWNSVKNDKEQKINSGETDKAQCSAETTTMYRKKPTRKTEAVQNTNPDETAAIGGTQPMKHFKAQGKDSTEQNISSAEIGQKTGSAEASAMYRRKPTRKTKAEQNRNPGETATIRRNQTKHAKAQGTDSKERNISSAETAQKTGSAETTTGQPWQISWIGKKPRLRK
ncbi:hypothetical protein SETIT_9G170800v2 [Setaria italica]|uniref:Uncharacterized protein n=2 Tax=Setaria italica TaxID=4555 RepID=A0A368SHG7_SETIT|nr:hypothetical protein SETIT_9G170800v2 [Setaria italica]